MCRGAHLYLGLLGVVLSGSSVGGTGETQIPISAEAVDQWPAGPVQTSAGIAGSAPVEQTGQRSCWNSDGIVRDCTGTGEDGELQAGVQWPAPRFMDNGNGTVTDNLTGLIWLKNANCFGTLTWMQALLDANDLMAGHCGLTDGSVATDWRLSNLKELLSLIDYGEFDPALPPGHPFSDVPLDFHWSSTTDLSLPDRASGVSVRNGGIFSILKVEANRFYAWPVRGTGLESGAGSAPVEDTGQQLCWDELGVPIVCSGTSQDGELQAGVDWPVPRFTDNGNGTVMDNLTGLIWLKNANCFGSRTWTQALSDARGLMTGQCGLTDGSMTADWRLSNVNELLSLADYGEFDPALPSGHPFSGVQALYWSSSTRVQAADEAWVVFMASGGTAGGFKVGGVGYGWAVRGGSIREVRGTCSRYELVRVGSPLSWDEARTLAQTLGPTWDLASITSAEENDFVESLFANDPSFFNMDAFPGATNRSGPWIGAFDVSGPTDFEWVSGEPVTFTNWGPAEPFGNGDTISYTDFSSPYGDGSGIAWNDIGPDLRLDGPIAYVAESRVPGSPIPGSQVIFCDGFESGDTAAWSSTVARDLEVQTSNANSGLYAARLTVARTCTAGDAIVPDGDLSGDPPVEPCGRLTANDVNVVSGTVRFAAGIAIEIGTGFSVASAAAFVAEAGETVLGSAYVRDESPESVTEYQLRFALDPDALTLAQDSEQFDHLVAYDAQGNPEFVIGVTYNSSLAENRLFVTAWENDGTPRTTKGLCELSLTSDWQPVAVSWTASTGTDGDIEISVDGGGAQSLVTCLSLAGGLNNGIGEISAVEWGAQNVSSGSFGEMDLDDFQSWEPQ